MIIILAAPALSLAQDPPLIPCGQSDVKTGIVAKQCDFKGFMHLLNNIINFILFKLALPLAAIMFAYAGVRLIMSPTGEGKTKAKNIFVNTAIGIALAAGGWLIVKTLLAIAGYEAINTFFN